MTITQPARGRQRRLVVDGAYSTLRRHVMSDLPPANRYRILANEPSITAIQQVGLAEQRNLRLT
ncbi:hypothetical protein [Paraburkholderia ultramafica]|uniref:hypothetical protein n=1 Tax=Paraburkholderia ultramafica TaxID=1544867 RepID=UPI0015840756|nr:hypothetical protein [Paraburkholderia ultramafica]